VRENREAALPVTIMKAIAIDLDDTLNDFTATLRRAEFVRDGFPELSEEVFRDHLAKVRSNWTGEGELLSTEYTYFRYRIHQQCYERARAREDGVEFLRRLRAQGWRIVICTQRDLRRAQACTRKWLDENGIPFDDLFMAGNKVVFCRLWGIGHLVDDHPFNREHGERYGLKVYYPGPPEAVESQGQAVRPHRARSFQSFAEIIPWIQE